MIPTLTKRSATFAFLLTLLTSTQIATAWYDPSAQRWINRDPVADASSVAFVFLKMPLGRSAAAAETAEGPNVFQSARNNPVSTVDYWGLWCGAANPGSVGADATVPDNPLGFEFGDACEAHDHCYNTCGASKQDCDRKFLKDMRDKCHSYQPALANPGFCRLLAYTYYQAVNWGGGRAYADGQQMACSACPMIVPRGSPPSIVRPGTVVVYFEEYEPRTAISSPLPTELPPLPLDIRRHKGQRVDRSTALPAARIERRCQP